MGLVADDHAQADGLIGVRSPLQHVIVRVTRAVVLDPPAVVNHPVHAHLALGPDRRGHAVFDDERRKRDVCPRPLHDELREDARVVEDLFVVLECLLGVFARGPIGMSTPQRLGVHEHQIFPIGVPAGPVEPIPRDHFVPERAEGGAFGQILKERVELRVPFAVKQHVVLEDDCRRCRRGGLLEKGVQSKQMAQQARNF